MPRSDTVSLDLVRTPSHGRTSCLTVFSSANVSQRLHTSLTALIGKHLNINLNTDALAAQCAAPRCLTQYTRRVQVDLTHWDSQSEYITLSALNSVLFAGHLIELTVHISSMGRKAFYLSKRSCCLSC